MLVASGRHVGRPTGTVKAENELLREHAAVVEGLVAGDSLREAAERAGAAVNTVRKVKVLLLEDSTTRKARSSSRLPLRPVAASILDWRRVSGKRGDLLVCGHFVSEAEWDVGETRKARRCPYCAKGKNDSELPAYAVTFLDRPWEMDRKTLEFSYHRPLLLHASSEEAALARVRKSLDWRKLPEGTEVWEVADPSTVGAGTSHREPLKPSRFWRPTACSPGAPTTVKAAASTPLGTASSNPAPACAFSMTSVAPCGETVTSTSTVRSSR